MRGGFREEPRAGRPARGGNRRPRPRGIKPSVGKCHERRAPRNPGNTGPRVADSADASIPGAAAGDAKDSSETGAATERTARGAARIERCGGYRRGRTSEGEKPMSVTGMKQGRKGCGRNKASRGRESLKAQHSRVRQARRRSLSVSSHAEGCQTSWKGRLGPGDPRAGDSERASGRSRSREATWRPGKRRREQTLNARPTAREDVRASARTSG
jgi:hypothetical protein